MNAPTNLPAERRDAPPIDKLKANLSTRANEFKVALPSHISVDKFQRTIATAAMSNPKLLECDRTSLLLASMKLAQDGLLPDGREAALVPFKQSFKGDDNQWYERWLIQPMPMVYGLRKKILQSGQVVSLETGVVYRAEADSGHFIYEIGLDPPIRHRPNLDLTEEEMHDDNIVAAYSIARLKNDNGEAYWSVEVMRRVEINKVRQTSQTGALGQVVKFGKNKGKLIEPKGPWVDWFGEMARKTVLRRHSKVLPMSGDILDTIDREDEAFAAEGATRILDTEETGPVRLPNISQDDDGQDDERVDVATGEVIEQGRDPATGMTEVDEETARKLDAGGGDDDDSQQEDVEADFIGTVAPARAEVGQSWFNPDDEKTRYAHDTKNGIKWYLKPPVAEPDADAVDVNQADQQQEAAQQTVEAIDGPLEHDEQPAWVAMVERAKENIAKAPDHATLKKLDTEFQKHMAVLPENAVQDVDAAFAARRKVLNEAQEG